MMERINRDAIGEAIGRIGCCAVVVAVAVLLIIELI